MKSVDSDISADIYLGSAWNKELLFLNSYIVTAPLWKLKSVFCMIFLPGAPSLTSCMCLSELGTVEVATAS